MRYLAQRIRTGEWLHRDLPLADVERAKVLSGPTTIAGKIEPELFRQRANDGMRILDPWYSTMLYCESDDGRLLSHGIIKPPMSWAAAATSVSAAGVTSFPHGYIYNGVKNYGPLVLGDQPPDSIYLFRDLWDHVQSDRMGDLGVEVVGPATSGVPRGTFEEPFVMSQWKGDDVGKVLDDLAAGTPFDYIEEVEWANEERQEVAFRVRLGHPRLGRARDDLRFVEGENITEALEPAAPEGYTNDVIGFGNGSGSTLVHERSTVDDGRLRRTRAVTDKTIRDHRQLQRLVQNVRERYANVDDVDVASIKVREHPNAPIEAINPGDDIFVQSFVPAFGQIRGWYRVLSVAPTQDNSNATLSLARSSTFFYNTTTLLDTADPGDSV